MLFAAWNALQPALYTMQLSAQSPILTVWMSHRLPMKISDDSAYLRANLTYIQSLLQSTASLSHHQTAETSNAKFTNKSNSWQ